VLRNSLHINTQIQLKEDTLLNKKQKKSSDIDLVSFHQKFLFIRLATSELIETMALNKPGLTQINRNLPPTPNSGGARDQSLPELGDLGGECVSPINVYFKK